MHSLPPIFFGFAAFILAVASVIFSIVLIRASEETERTVRNVFLLISSASFSMAFIFTLLQSIFHITLFSGLKTHNFESGFLLLGVICLNAVLWQEAEHGNLL